MFSEWLEMLRDEFAHYNRGKFQRDLLAGLTVAAVALPLALAFGVASGADAAAGLVTAILAGILIGGLGGAPFQISGPTGAMSAVLIVLAARYGLGGVWVAGVIAGLIILVTGALRLGRIVSLIPTPVISGFTSGIAVIIALGQIDNFLGIKTPAAERITQKIAYYFVQGVEPNWGAVGLALVVMLVMIYWPRLPQGSHIPGSLMGIVVATLLSLLPGIDAPAIGTIPRTILLEQRLTFAAIPWENVGALIVPALSIAALGAIESLLCAAVGGNMTGIRPHNNIELVAQGLGNILIPFFGGVPATAAIARTSVAIKSGSITRLTSVIHSLALLAIVFVAAPLIGRVPLAALAGVLLVTAWRMNEWHAIHFFFGKRLKHAMIAFTVTLAATVLLDLTQAILIGFAMSSLIFMAQMSELQISRRPVDGAQMAAAGHGNNHHHDNAAVYYLSGPLFFAAVRRLHEAVEKHDPADARLIFSMRGVPLIDATGIAVLREIFHRQHAGGGDLLLAGVDSRVESLLRRSGFLDEFGPQRIYWGTDEAIVALGAKVSLLPPVVEDMTGDLSHEAQASLVFAPHAERAEHAETDF
ncbi:MAG: SulP family inorganic anion transporter [Chloroflexi bacterium]|nr:MAG: SulP family inorganic anion transporter [Chloroflexota bacterium]